jgi:hypothetical protein
MPISLSHHSSPTIAIRLAGDDDDAALAKLAALDSAVVPFGRLLLAAVDGEPLAAVPVAGGPAIADPFHPTAELVELLRARAAHLRGDAPAGRIRRRLAHLTTARVQ